jgi:hypothetical protein
MQRICVVQDRFEIEGKGLVLACVTHDDTLRLEAGKLIEIRLASSPAIRTRILGFELLRNDWSPHKPKNMAVLVPLEIGLENVPRESEIWAQMAQQGVQRDGP